MLEVEDLEGLELDAEVETPVVKEFKLEELNEPVLEKETEVAKLTLERLELEMEAENLEELELATDKVLDDKELKETGKLYELEIKVEERLDTEKELEAGDELKTDEEVEAGKEVDTDNAPEELELRADDKLEDLELEAEELNAEELKL